MLGKVIDFRSRAAPALCCVDVRHRLGRRWVLDGVQFTLERGGVVVISGESGAGKSTLVQLLAGLEEPQAGVVSSNGIPVARQIRDARRRKQPWMGLVMQGLHCYPHKRVIDNLTLAPRKVLRRTGSEMDSEAQALLDRFGLGDRARAYPGQLSQGERQRVAIARALMASPPLLLLDEPTSALNDAWKDVLVEELHARREAGASICAITHDCRFARALGGRAYVLAGGRLGGTQPSGGEVVEMSG